MRVLPILQPGVNGATAWFAERGGGLRYREDDEPTPHEFEDMVAAKARARASRGNRSLRARIGRLVGR